MYRRGWDAGVNYTADFKYVVPLTVTAGSFAGWMSCAVPSYYTYGVNTVHWGAYLW